MMHKAWCLEEVPYCFSRSSVKFQCHTAPKNRRFWPKLGVQFEFTKGYEMMLKAWSSLATVPYCFPRSSIKFQGHMGQNIANFDPNWAFPDCNSSPNSLMDLKWCTKFGRSYQIRQICLVSKWDLLKCRCYWNVNFCQYSNRQCVFGGCSCAPIFLTFDLCLTRNLAWSYARNGRKID